MRDPGKRRFFVGKALQKLPLGIERSPAHWDLEQVHVAETARGR